MNEILIIDELLSYNTYKPSDIAHIVVDTSKCDKCNLKPCVYLCPSACYREEHGEISFTYISCIECGTCRIICPEEAVKWDYPEGGKGILYKAT